MKKLYQFTVMVLDDQTFSEKQMVANVVEALNVHLEAMGIKVTLDSVSDIILDSEGELVEA